MITISKKRLVLYILISVVAGAAIFFGVTQLMRATGVGTVKISQTEYTEYQQLKDRYGKLNTMYDAILTSYYKEVDEEDLKTGMYQGLFAGLDDPYSQYFTADEYCRYQEDLSGEFEGIGIMYKQEQTGTSRYEITGVISGSPAESAGLKKGDIITAVDGKEYTSITDVQYAIRGEAGTEVTITYERDGTSQDVTIVRAKIESDKVTSKVLDGNIGYIKIPAFVDDTGSQFLTALEDLESQGITSLIIDLRDNGGGYVTQADIVADSLLGDCNMYYTVDHNGNKSYVTSDSDKVSIPYVILVNENTASASEIVSAAVQANDGGQIVGTTTYGKGVIQVDVPLEDGDGYKMTVEEYYSVDDEEINGNGITPDVEVSGSDAQLQKAIDLLQ